MTQPSGNNRPAPPAPRSLGPSKSGRCFASRELIWDNLDLRLGRGRVVATVVPDSRWLKMYRVKLPNGHLTDMINLTRAKDAAVGRTLTELNGFQTPRKPGRASSMRETEAAA
jgi:hypothetical protein